MTNNAKEAQIREYALAENVLVELDLFYLILSAMKVRLKCFQRNPSNTFNIDVCFLKQCVSFLN